MSTLSIHDRARFWDKVDKTSGCWVWAAWTTPKGYGQFWLDGKMRSAHRIAYLLEHGELPEGLTLDHLCRNRACVNPDHLEPVTNHENVLRGNAPAAVNARKTECVHGHALTPDNVLPRSDGGRRCRTCRRAEKQAVA